MIIVNRNCLQGFCCDLISGKLVFKLIYITILLCYTIHVVSFRNTILISTIGTCIISIGENNLSVEYSDIYHVLSNLFP